MISLVLLPTVLFLGLPPGQARLGGPDVNVSNGPVRMARVSYVEGNVDWRPDYQGDWSQATVNLPLREGAQLWSPGSHRAELQFDDGSLLRLSDGAIVTLKEMYSDRNGEFTLIKLTGGAVQLTARNPHSIYQIDTPCDSVKAEGPSKVQVRAEMSSTDVYSRGGRPQIIGPKGTTTLPPNNRAIYHPDGTATSVAPQPTNWDKFNDQRDERMGRPERFAPSNVSLVSGDLDNYGDWDSDPDYGHVWYPRVHQTNWRPYYDGNWTWVEPVGWTWVSAEPWGWAPYHYGSWIRRHRGWAWVPGPAAQPWSPAVVDFTYDDGNVGWAPLAPAEIHYGPAVSVGFGSGNWSLFFSIGSVASYYPAGSTWCAPTYYDPIILRRRGNPYANLVTFRNWRPGPRDFGRWHFVPRNAARYGGGAYVAVGSFGNRARFRPLDPRRAVMFRRGRSLAPSGRWAQARPFFARPSRVAMTPTRRVFKNAAISRVAMNRAVFHARDPRSPMAKVHLPGRQWNAANAAANHRLHEAQAAARARQALAQRRNPADRGRAAKFANAHARAAAAARAHVANHRTAPTLGRAAHPKAPAPRAATHQAPNHANPAHRPATHGATVRRGPVHNTPVHRGPVHNTPAHRTPARNPARQTPPQRPPVRRGPVHRTPPVRRTPVNRPPVQHQPPKHQFTQRPPRQSHPQNVNRGGNASQRRSSGSRTNRPPTRNAGSRHHRGPGG